MNERDQLMLNLLIRYRMRVGYGHNNMRLWKGLCGKFSQHYGTKMPENLTEHALLMGVIAS